MKRSEVACPRWEPVSLQEQRMVTGFHVHWISSVLTVLTTQMFILGPGAYSFFEQGDTTGNPFWQLVGNSLRPPTRDDRDCHAPKPILLMTGRMSCMSKWINLSIIQTS